MLGALEAVATAVGVAGCLLPWVRAEVRVTAASATTTIDAFHDIGIAACAGAALALAALALALWRGARGAVDEAGRALGATLMVAGSALFVTPAGQPLGSGAPGTGGSSWAVRLAPGPVVTGAAGLTLLALSGWWAARRRGGSPSRA